MGFVSVCWHQRSAKFARKPVGFHSRCPREQAARVSLWSQSSLMFEDNHLLIPISGFPSLRYFPSNSVHYSLLSNPNSSLCSAQRSPLLLLQPLSPHCIACKLPPWPSSSQAQLHICPLSNPFLSVGHRTLTLPHLILGALSPSLPSHFSPLPWSAAQSSWSPLLLIQSLCSLSCWSSFSHCLHLSTHQLPAGQNTDPFILSSRTLMKNYSWNTVRWLKPTIAPKEVLLPFLEPTTTIYMSAPWTCLRKHSCWKLTYPHREKVKFQQDQLPGLAYSSWKREITEMSIQIWE